MYVRARTNRVLLQSLSRTVLRVYVGTASPKRLQEDRPCVSVRVVDSDGDEVVTAGTQAHTTGDDSSDL